MSTAVKKIKYFSVVDFKNFMKSLGYISYDYNRRIPYNDIPRQDFAVISIGNVEWLPDADKNNDLWANGTNTHWLPGIYDNVLNIEFSDTGEGDFEAMSVEQGKEIVDFVKKLFPSLYPANKNNGMLNANIVVPIGIFKK